MLLVLNLAIVAIALTLLWLLLVCGVRLSWAVAIVAILFWAGAFAAHYWEQSLIKNRESSPE